MSDKKRDEEVRRLIEQRLKRNALRQTRDQPYKGPPLHFNCRSSLSPLSGLAGAIFQLALRDALAAQEEIAAGIPTGPGSARGSWADLEKALGKETVDRIRSH